MAGLLTGLRTVPYHRSFGRDLPHGDRQGVELSIETDDGRSGLGEVAPLDDFGSETLDEARAALERALTALRSNRPPVPEAIDDIPEILTSIGIQREVTPTAYAGLELALLDLLARDRGIPLCGLLSRDKPHAVVPVNTLIAGTDPDRVVQEAKLAVQEGFLALKIKVGSISPDHASELLARVRDAVGPLIRVRADANRAWEEDRALQAWPALSTLDLDYIEEPCSNLRALLGRRGSLAPREVPVAADESSCPAGRAWPWLHGLRPDVFILKPLLFGGILETLRFAAAARASGARVVVTSGLEGRIGLAAALHLAAALPGDVAPAGLAAARLPHGDEGSPRWLIPHDGALWPPGRPGLGLPRPLPGIIP